MIKERSKKQKKEISRSGNYSVGDFIIRFKNAALAGRKEFIVSKTNLIEEMAISLRRLGYIDQVLREGGNLIVRISYERKEPVLNDIKVVSRPGLRIYIGKPDLEKRKSPTILLLSTSKGILSSQEAIKKGVGGEVLAEIL